MIRKDGKQLTEKDRVYALLLLPIWLVSGYIRRGSKLEILLCFALFVITLVQLISDIVQERKGYSLADRKQVFAIAWHFQFIFTAPLLLILAVWLRQTVSFYGALTVSLLTGVVANIVAMILMVYEKGALSEGKLETKS